METATANACARLSSLQGKHLRLLEALGVAVRREREALQRCEVVGAGRAEACKEAAREAEERARESAQQENERLREQVDELQKTLKTKEEEEESRRREEREKTSQALSNDTEKLEREAASVREELERREKEWGQRLADANNLNRSLEERVAKNEWCMNDERKKTDGVRKSLEESRRACEKLSSELSLTKDKLQSTENNAFEANTRFAGLRKEIARLEELCTSKELAIEHVSNQVAKEQQAREELSRQVEEHKGRSEELSAQVDRLERLCEQYKLLAEKVSVGSRFNEFVEMKNTNKKLQEKISHMERKLRKPSHGLQVAEAEAKRRGSFSSSQRALVLYEGVESDDSHSNGREPVKMPVIRVGLRGNNESEVEPSLQNSRKFPRY